MAGDKTLAFMHLLEDKNDCGALMSSNLLTACWRKLAFDTRLTYSRYNLLIEHYIALMDLPHSKTKNIKGNITKSFTEPEFTWDIFCKSLVLFNYTYIDLVFEIELSDDRVIEVPLKLNTFYSKPKDLLFHEAMEQNSTKLTLVRNSLIKKLIKVTKSKDITQLKEKLRANIKNNSSGKLNASKISNLFTVIHIDDSPISYKKLLEFIEACDYKKFSIHVTMRKGKVKRYQTVSMKP